MWPLIRQPQPAPPFPLTHLTKQLMGEVVTIGELTKGCQLATVRLRRKENGLNPLCTGILEKGRLRLNSPLVKMGRSKKRRFTSVI